MRKRSEDLKAGVILMTYGSATTAEHVAEYLNHVCRGKASEELIKDFEERYRLVGHSPLVEITEKQGKLLEKLLNGHEASYDHGQNDDDYDGARYVVRAGMLHSEPFIEDAVRELKGAGAKKLVGIILSPQFSSFIMDGYGSALVQAAKECGFKEADVTIAKPWPTEPNFIALLTSRVQEALKRSEKLYGKKIPIIFTTHSLPQRVVKKDPGYLEQLRLTIDAILKSLNNSEIEWYAGYQSAGHTPEAWLKPDLTKILDGLRMKDPSAVLIVPIQFLADHLEILYDLDIAAREQCETRGINYHRIQLPNIDPKFIGTLAAIARTTNEPIQP